MFCLYNHTKAFPTVFSSICLITLKAHFWLLSLLQRQPMLQVCKWDLTYITVSQQSRQWYVWYVMCLNIKEKKYYLLFTIYLPRFDYLIITSSSTRSFSNIMFDFGETSPNKVPGKLRSGPSGPGSSWGANGTILWDDHWLFVSILWAMKPFVMAILRGTQIMSFSERDLFHDSESTKFVTSLITRR